MSAWGLRAPSSTFTISISNNNHITLYTSIHFLHSILSTLSSLTQLGVLGCVSVWGLGGIFSDNDSSVAITFSHFSDCTLSLSTLLISYSHSIVNPLFSSRNCEYWGAGQCLGVGGIFSDNDLDHLQHQQQSNHSLHFHFTLLHPPTLTQL